MPEIDDRDRHDTQSVTPLTQPPGTRPPFGAGLVEFALGGFALGTGEFASMGLLPDIAGDVGVSIPTAGLAISACALGVVVGAPVIAAAFARAGW